MFKSVVKCIVFASLAFGGASAALALPDGIETFESWHYVDQNTIRACDASARFTFWNVGDDTWVITNVEPKIPGGRHEN